MVKDKQKRRGVWDLEERRVLGILGLGLGMLVRAGAGTGDRAGLQAKRLDLVL